MKMVYHLLNIYAKLLDIYGLKLIPILSILFRPFGCIAPKDLKIIWQCSLSTLRVADECYSRKVSCAHMLFVFSCIDNNVYVACFQLY
jgi:hypothetical protein